MISSLRRRAVVGDMSSARMFCSPVSCSSADIYPHAHPHDQTHTHIHMYTHIQYRLKEDIRGGKQRAFPTYTDRTSRACVRLDNVVTGPCLFAMRGCDVIVGGVVALSGESSGKREFTGEKKNQEILKKKKKQEKTKQDKIKIHS